MTLKTITIAALLLGTTLTSGALTLGRVRGAAWIGQPLDITISVQLDGAASATPLCAEADVFHADSRQDVAKVRVSTAPTAQADTVNLRVQSSALIDEPVVTVYLRAGCTTKTSRRYVLLADFPSEASAPLTRFVAPAVPAVPTIVVPEAPAPAPAAAPQAIATPAAAQSASVAPPAAAVVQTAQAAPAPLASAMPAPTPAQSPSTAPAASPAPAPVAIPAPSPAAAPAQPSQGASVSGTVTQPAAEKSTASQNSTAKPVTKPAQKTQALALAPPASPAKPVPAKPAPAKPVQAAPAQPRPSEPKAAAPQPRMPKPAEPAAPAGKPRLQLDPLDNLNERIRNLEAGVPASAASDSERARMDQLQASVKALLDQSIKSEANLMALRQRLEQAESDRVPVSVVYALGALVVLSLGAVAYLWTRRKTTLKWDATQDEATP